MRTPFDSKRMKKLSCLKNFKRGNSTDVVADDPSPTFSSGMKPTRGTFFNSFSFDGLTPDEGNKNLKSKLLKLKSCQDCDSPTIGPKCEFEYDKYKGKVLLDEKLKIENFNLPQPKSSGGFQTLSMIEDKKISFTRNNLYGTNTVEAIKVEDDFYRYNRKNKIIDVDFGTTVHDPHGKEQNFKQSKHCQGILGGIGGLPKRKKKKRVTFSKTKKVLIFEIQTNSRSKSRRKRKKKRRKLSKERR